MNKGKKPIGWFDWQVLLSMFLFLVLMFCSHYFDLKILKYFAIIPAIYGVARTWTQALGW